jgi:hypothetical protein
MLIMRPSKFISHYERMLGRKLTQDELASVNAARLTSGGKREAVKAMRVALLGIEPAAGLGFRRSPNDAKTATPVMLQS